MPKAGTVEIIFVMDKSGSMEAVKEDAIGGFNSFIAEQKEVPGEATMTYTQFDTKYDIKFTGKKLEEVEDLNGDTYHPGGWTALYDAVGRTIDEVGSRLQALPEDQRPEKVLFAVMTDGHENSSQEYIHSQVADKIQHQTDKYSWEFFFLGANMDAKEVAKQLNIKACNSFDYDGDSVGTRKAYGTMSARIIRSRTR